MANAQHDERPRRPARRTTPPSQIAVARLNHALDDALRSFHDELSEDLLTTLLLRDAGKVDEARRVVERRRARLRDLEDALSAAVAAAVVERETEWILAAAARKTRAGPSRVPASLRTLATAVTVVAALAVALVSPPERTVAPELAAGHGDVSRTAAAPAGQPAVEAPSADLADETPGDARRPAADQNADAPAHATDDPLDVLRRSGPSGSLLARLTEDPRNAPLAHLLGVDRVVTGLETEADGPAQIAEDPAEPPAPPAVDADEPEAGTELDDDAEYVPAVPPPPRTGAPPSAGEEAAAPAPDAQADRPQLQASVLRDVL
ncbi:MAG: hypothetical protein KY462_08285 [Actinobacteria bacterium]|nr:hypothetical protein [Actinomycetota bacterium]